MILEIGNDLGEKAFFELIGEEPYITLKTQRFESGITYRLTQDNINELKNFIIDSKWLTTVTKEDLKTMLDCVKTCVIHSNKQANAACMAATQLSELYERYSNESGTKSD